MTQHTGDASTFLNVGLRACLLLRFVSGRSRLHQPQVRRSLFDTYFCLMWHR